MEPPALGVRARRLERLRAARPATPGSLPPGSPPPGSPPPGHPPPGSTRTSGSMGRPTSTSGGALPWPATPAAAPTTHASLAPFRSDHRAASLARALGGRVERRDGGSVVVLEASGPLPLPRGPLARLPDPADPDRPLVCLDSETTGLGTGAGTVPFLTGVGTWHDERFTVRQLLLPDHGDEPAFLAAVGAAIGVDAWLVTYNGRAFDWPLLVARFRLHRQAPPDHRGHLDLLSIARQLWRHRLPDARLASVEAGVAGVRRIEDVPGALIPGRYFDYLRSGRAELLRDVVRHNRQDVASLARLLHALARGLDPATGGAAMEPGDLGGLARAYVRRGRLDEALACLDAALGRQPRPPSGVTERLDADRARLLARIGRRAEAVAVWLRLAAAGGALSGLAWLQVAKHREHDAGDIGLALSAARHAASFAARARIRGLPVRWMERDLARRLPRLERRLGAALIDPARRPAA